MDLRALGRIFSVQCLISVKILLLNCNIYTLQMYDINMAKKTKLIYNLLRDKINHSLTFKGGIL